MVVLLLCLVDFLLCLSLFSWDRLLLLTGLCIADARLVFVYYCVLIAVGVCAVNSVVIFIEVFSIWFGLVLFWLCFTVISLVLVVYLAG